VLGQGTAVVKVCEGRENGDGPALTQPNSDAQIPTKMWVWQRGPKIDACDH